jgi:hypothetical protein
MCSVHLIFLALITLTIRGDGLVFVSVSNGFAPSAYCDTSVFEVYKRLVLELVQVSKYNNGAIFATNEKGNKFLYRFTSSFRFIHPQGY